MPRRLISNEDVSEEYIVLLGDVLPHYLKILTREAIRYRVLLAFWLEYYPHHLPPPFIRGPEFNLEFNPYPESHRIYWWWMTAQNYSLQLQAEVEARMRCNNDIERLIYEAMLEDQERRSWVWGTKKGMGGSNSCGFVASRFFNRPPGR